MTIVVNIIVPDQATADRVNKTPALMLSRKVLEVGENFEKVNPKQYADMVRMYPLIGIQVIKISTHGK